MTRVSALLLLLVLFGFAVPVLGAQEDELYMGVGLGMDLPLPEGWAPGMPLFSGIVNGARGRHEFSCELGFGITEPGETGLEPYGDGLYVLYAAGEYRFRLARWARFLTPCVTAGAGLMLLSWDNYDDQDDRESLMIPVFSLSAGFALFADMPPFTRIGFSCAPCLFLAGPALIDGESPAPGAQFGLRLSVSVTFRIRESDTAP